MPLSPEATLEKAGMRLLPPARAGAANGDARLKTTGARKARPPITIEHEADVGPRDDVPLPDGPPDGAHEQRQQIAHSGSGAGGDKAQPKVTFKTAADFFREYEPISYAIEGIVHSSKVYAVTAKTGGGKTGWLTAAALAVAMNRPDIIGRAVEPGRVLYGTFENPDDFRMKFMVAAYTFGISASDLAERLVIRDVKTSPEDLAASAKGPFALVIGDTHQAWFDGKDLNDNVQAGDFARRVRALSQIEGRPAVLMAAHPKKSANNDELVPYGGGATLNEIDGNLTMRMERGISELHWQGKYRGLDFEPIPYRFELNTCPAVVDVHGRAVQLPVIRPATSEFIEAREQKAINRDEALLRAMLVNPGASIRTLVTASAIPKASIERALPRLASSAAGKLVAKTLDKWSLTASGRTAIEGER